MLMSVDGKISTGNTKQRDVDKDFPTIAGIDEGLQQYYDLEKTTDYVSLNTGKVMAKIGVNTKTPPKQPMDCQFVIIDNKPHLTVKGVTYLTKWVSHLYVVTTNPKHPALQSTATNVTIIQKNQIDLPQLFHELWKDYKIKRITIQSGGTLNAALVRHNLIDQLWLVIAPALIGGKDTSTLIDGPSLRSQRDLQQIKTLHLEEVRQLHHSYLLVRYAVTH